MLSQKYPRETRSRRNQTTGVTLLLDMSGSMMPRRDETIREVNRYLDQLKRDGQRYRVTVLTFNEHVDELLVRADIKNVGQLERSEYQPNGWTRLLDAVGETLDSFQYPYERHLFAVITDGEENSSRNYGLSEVRDLIDRRRSEDFQFVFLGSGPGSWRTGNRLGFNFSVATDWQDPRNSENIYKSLYTASNSMSQGKSLQVNCFNTSSTTAKQTNSNSNE
jgi:Mg-chelatase subunit ChlD